MRLSKEEMNDFNKLYDQVYGTNLADHAVKFDEEDSHITVYGGAGKELKAIVNGLRLLADALERITE